MRFWLGFVVLLLAAQTSLGASLTIVVTGAASDRGQAVVRLFTSADGFPSNARAAVAQRRTAFLGGQAIVTFPDLPPGTYAAIAVHDLDGDGVMAKTFIGLPREGYAVSNNPRPLAVPRFDSAAFSHGSADQTLELVLVYY